MQSLNELKKTLVSDGKLTAEDVNVLRERMFDNEGMNREKADLLFYLKVKCNPEHVDDSFQELFIEAITSFLIDDERTPGEISDSEARWLRGKLQNHWIERNLDDTEYRLLTNLKHSSINFPEILDYRQSWKMSVEKYFYFSRYAAILTAIGSIFSAIFLMVFGLYNLFCNTPLPTEKKIDPTFSHIVTSVDMFLFSLVLLIMGFGVYEMFVHKIDEVETKSKRPSWMQITSVDGLKNQLGKVVVMVLIVTFLKKTLEIPFKGSLDLLFFAIGIVLIAIALYVANNYSKRSNDSKEK